MLWKYLFIPRGPEQHPLGSFHPSTWWMVLHPSFCVLLPTCGLLILWVSHSAFLIPHQLSVSPCSTLKLPSTLTPSHWSLLKRCQLSLILASLQHHQNVSLPKQTNKWKKCIISFENENTTKIVYALEYLKYEVFAGIKTQELALFGVGLLKLYFLLWISQAGNLRDRAEAVRTGRCGVLSPDVAGAGLSAGGALGSIPLPHERYFLF